MANFCDVIPTTNDEGGVDEVSKFTFLDIDKTKLENVNREGHKASKHGKVWMKNVFDKWPKYPLQTCLKMKILFPSLLIYFHFLFFKLQRRMGVCTFPPSKYTNFIFIFIL